MASEFGIHFLHTFLGIMDTQIVCDIASFCVCTLCVCMYVYMCVCVGGGSVPNNTLILN